jgi:hypothetical protein
MSCIVTIYGPAVIIKAAKRYFEKTEDCFQGCYTEASNRVGDTLRVAYKIRQGTGGEVGQSQAGSGDLIIGQ